MFSEREIALHELDIAGGMNPGPWTAHSQNVAKAAQLIAKSAVMDGEKAFVCGLLHDIGRRTGIAAVRHIIDGYDYAVSKGCDEVARVCLTHSFPVKDVDADIGRRDITDEQYRFVKAYIKDIEYDDYDDYDKLIILCDSLADTNGFCILEKRFVDTTRRYGAYPFTVDRWNRIFEFKEYFEKLSVSSVYRLLPGIENCIYA